MRLLYIFVSIQMSQPIQILSEAISSGGGSSVETITIPMIVEKNSSKPLDLIWRDHGNGLRSIHFSRALDGGDLEDSTIASGCECLLTLSNYKFEGDWHVGFATYYDSDTQAPPALCSLHPYHDEPNKIWFQCNKQRHLDTSDTIQVDICLPAEAIPKPEEYSIK